MHSASPLDGSPILRHQSINDVTKIDKNVTRVNILVDKLV